MSELNVLELESYLQPIIGKEGAQTFFNVKVGEAYHSVIGPIIEAEHKFVKPCKFEDLISKNQKIKILDLFFGLGYNTGIALHYINKRLENETKNMSPEVEILGIENDPLILKQVKNLLVPEWYTKWKNLLSELSFHKKLEYKNISMKIIIDDVFKIIGNLQEKSFDVIFFDPFSHKTKPEFWTEAFLNKVFNLLAPGGVLTTYSSLKKLRNCANDFGLSVIEIEPVGRKKPSLALKFI